MQQVGFDPEASLAAARAAHDEHIFVAGVLGVCGAAVHHQPFCFGQEDVILKFWCLKWLDMPQRALPYSRPWRYFFAFLPRK